MVPVVQTIENTNINVIESPTETAIHILHDELAKGILSMKNGEVYTIEEAWEEIDKI